MESSKIRKIFYYSLGAVALFLLFLLVILPHLIDTATIKAKIESEIQKATALDTKIMGHIKISFIPKTSIRCMDLSIADGKDNFNVSVKEAYVDVGLTALLKKTIIIKQIYLLSPHIKVDWQKLSKDKTSPVVQETKTIDQNRAHTQDFQIRNLKIENGLLLLVHDLKKFEFQNINLTTPLLSFSQDSKILGSVKYREINLNFELNLSPLNGFFEGQDLSISTKLDSKNIFEASLSGTFRKEEYGCKYMIKGEGKSKDILALSRVFDLDTSKFKSNNSSIDVKVEGGKDKINLNMTWEVGSQRLLLEGHYIPSKSYGRLQLRSDILNLDKLLYLDKREASKGTVHKQAGGPPEVESGKARSGKSTSLDFSVAVDKIIYNAKTLENLNVSGKYADDKIEIDRASFNLWDGAGIIRGKYNIIDKKFQGTLEIKDMALYKILKEIANHTNLTGRILANININSFQIVSSDILQQIVAQGNFVLKQGTIRNNKKLLDIANIIGFFSGEIEKKEYVHYEINLMRFRMKEGKVLIEQGDLSSDLGDASFYGEVNILSEQLEMVAKPRNLRLLTKSPFVSLKIYGPFSEIKVKPEFKALPKEGLKDLVDPLKHRLFKFKEELR